jgi:hypothetical protein
LENNFCDCENNFLNLLQEFDGEAANCNCLEVGIGAIGRPQKLGLKDLTTN